MAELLISEVVRASGVASSALRYYERFGLLVPVGRTAGGYRVYDGRAVERLAFITRAKRLGLDLHEIKDLVALWDDGPCEPVQSRLSALLDDKVAMLESQIDELSRFHAQLVHVQRSLASTEATDRCGPGCGCDSELPDASEVAVVCTLDPGDVPQRARDWQTVLEQAEARLATPDGVRLRFPRDADMLGALATLAANEVACCSFFTFTLTLDAHAAWLAISAPPEAVSLVVDFFGPVDG